MDEDKRSFKARFGTREDALEAIRNIKPAHWYTGAVATSNTALTHEDLMGLLDHEHEEIRRGASLALNKRGWKRKSILEPKTWVQFDPTYGGKDKD